MTDHDEPSGDAARVEDLAVKAALGELTPEERAELDSAAAADPRLQDELDADAEVVASLQRGAAVAPPPRLRDAVLSAVAATPQDSAADDAVAAPTPLRRRRGWAAPLLAAAAVATLAVGAVVIVIATSADDDPVESVTDAPDVVVSSFQGSLDGSLTSYTSASAEAVVLRGTGVPSVDPTETYQAWSIRGDDATSLGQFRPDDDGTVEVVFEGVADVVQIGITLEPAGGSTRPTPPVLASA